MVRAQAGGVGGSVPPREPRSRVTMSENNRLSPDLSDYLGTLGFPGATDNSSSPDLSDYQKTLGLRPNREILDRATSANRELLGYVAALTDIDAAQLAQLMMVLDSPARP